MANVLFTRKSGKSAIDNVPIIDGQLLFDTSGNGKMYLDNGTNRIEMGGAKIVDATLSKTSTNPIQNRAVAGVMLDNLNDISNVTRTGFLADAMAVKELNSNLDGISEYFNNNIVVLNGSDHIDLQTSQGRVRIACNSEGGNVRLTKITSDGLDPHIEIDTFSMNGSNGSARLYIGNSKNEAYTFFNFCEDGYFQDGRGNNTGALAAAVANATNAASLADAKSNSAINAVNALAGALSNLQVYFEDTVASSLIDLFNKKTLSARSKLSNNGVFANYGGWSGHDFGLFIGQVVNRNVLGLYIVSDGLYKVWLSDGTSSCSYVKIMTGNPIS